MPQQRNLSKVKLSYLRAVLVLASLIRPLSLPECFAGFDFLSGLNIWNAALPILIKVCSKLIILDGMVVTLLDIVSRLEVFQGNVALDIAFFRKEVKSDI